LIFDAVLIFPFDLPPQKFKADKKQTFEGMTMVSHAAIVVSPIHLSVRSRIIAKAMLLLALSVHSFGKVAAFQPLRRISRTRTITTTQFSLSTQLPMSSSIEQERKVPVNSLRSFHSSRSHANDSDSDTLVLDPLIVCGPSGVGKGTIIEKFMREFGGSEHFGFTVSHTSRSPREGEADGVHYHFSTVDGMRDLLQREHFLEHAEVHGNIYGTSWSSIKSIQADGFRGLLDIDTQGVKRIKTLEDSTDGEQQQQFLLKPKYIFIAPPSIETLKERLMGRKSESEESLQRRIGNAKAEVTYGLAEGNFDAIITNDDLEQACRDFDRTVRDLYNL
jgi:guanylate kinase